MSDDWNKATVIQDKLKQFSEALNTVMVLLLENEKKKLENVKRLTDVISKKDG